jgi:molybdenum cofactor cytidylyltransferase
MGAGALACPAEQGSAPFCYLRAMGRAPSFCGVILAAGASTRMGRDKALLPWPPNEGRGGTFLSAMIRALTSQTDLVIVVTGTNTSQLAPIIYAQGAFLVENPQPARGQFSSLQAGLHNVLSRGRDAAVITLVDRPPVQPATLQRLLLAFERALEQTNTQRKWAVVPEFGGKHGHPILASREMMEAFLRAPSTSNAREVEHAHEEFIDYVLVDDPFVALNVDTPEDYAALAV